MAKITIKSLMAELAEAMATSESRSKIISDTRAAKTAAEEREKQTRAQFDDLKERLAGAESENQRMRGYIQRVQEDDTVREELLTVGDPEGERHMVPKRKSTRFNAPTPYSNTGEIDHSFLYRDDSEPRRKAKNWIAY